MPCYEHGYFCRVMFAPSGFSIANIVDYIVNRGIGLLDSIIVGQTQMILKLSIPFLLS